MALTIGDQPFRSREEARGYVRALIARHPDDVAIPSPDHEFLCALLARHPSAAQNIGGGIRAFRLGLEPTYRRHRQLLIERQDGTVTDVRWRVCIDGQPPAGDVLGALREAVVDYILAFKREAFRKPEPVTCPITGEVLRPETAHVGHTVPPDFAMLVEGWLAHEGLALHEVEVTPLEDMQAGRQMADLGQRQRWQAYHHRHARLRLISAEANVRYARRQNLEFMQHPAQARRMRLVQAGFRWDQPLGLWVKGPWRLSDEAIDRVPEEAWPAWVRSLQQSEGGGCAPHQA